MRQLALLASASPSGRSIIFKLPQEIYTTLAKTGAPARQVTRHSYMNGAPPVTLPGARIAHTDEWGRSQHGLSKPRFSRMKIMDCGPATGATGSRPGLRYRRGTRERPARSRPLARPLSRRIQLGRLLLVWRNISTASCVSPVDPFTSPRTTREA